ncbi:pyrroline-5-carboxylate reductase [Oleiphilus messinensis]|uniref:Pyrroline-5-carboxylate reductase n=1 Tax=Oleiphilus messinensis TaxID=141451 RepID=A0A1Y0I3J1_9GAMM|nr:pyrroline-5-carboxylate reductase [Oleiphilus messinensis]ARU55037.1 pyrroline-5-carboxylate reductase [Oleiphilus messinensis]
MQAQPKIVFIGAGNMASSIIGGLIANGYAPETLCASAPEPKHLEHLSSQYGIGIEADNGKAAESADILVLAVKPQIIKPVCTEIASAIKKDTLVISIAAGVATSQISEWLGGTFPIVRCMPNTPALVQQGASGLYANAQVSEIQLTMAETIFAAVGEVDWVEDESDMHAITAISGSGPAYFFLILEALQEAGTNAGLSASTARRLATQTMLGAAQMAQHSELELAQLKKNVMSPGGTTEQAINTFESGNLKDLINEAVQAAKTRSIELSSLFDS